jgi:hypothetical protein
MILDRKEKQPAEVKDYPIDYSEWLGEITAGDTIASAVAVSACTSDSSDTALVVNQVVISNTAVTVWLSAGTTNQKYKVTVTVTTVGGRIDQSEFIVKVKDR